MGAQIFGGYNPEQWHGRIDQKIFWFLGFWITGFVFFLKTKWSYLLYFLAVNSSD